MNDLLERFLTDRAALDTDQLATLTMQLQEDPRLATEARSLLQIDELLSRRFASDRGHFATRVTTRLATADSGTFVRRVRSPLKLRRRRSRSGSRWQAMAAAAAGLMVLVAGWILLQRGNDGAAPVLTIAASGQVTRAGQALGTGTVIRVGDELRVIDGTATLVWADGTRVRLDSGAHLTLTGTAPKRLRLNAGSLDAEVSRQPTGAPMTAATRDALATVLGTRLRLTVGRATRLDVLEGRVGFAGSGAGPANSIEVAAGGMATCIAGQAPRMLSRQMLIAFGRGGRVLPAGTLEDHGATFASSRGYGWERANDGSDLPGVLWMGAPRTRDRVLVDPWSAADALHDSGLSVGWAGHTDTWRMALPDGRYQLTIAVGGTTREQGPHRVLAQGQTVVADVITAAGEVRELSATVVVTDGWLRLQVGGTTAPPSPTGDNSSDTILCFLRLTALE